MGFTYNLHTTLSITLHLHGAMLHAPDTREGIYLDFSVLQTLVVFIDQCERRRQQHGTCDPFTLQNLDMKTDVSYEITDEGVGQVELYQRKDHAPAVTLTCAAEAIPLVASLLKSISPIQPQRESHESV